MISTVLTTVVIWTNYFDILQRTSQKGKPSKGLFCSIKTIPIGRIDRSQKGNDALMISALAPDVSSHVVTQRELTSGVGTPFYCA
jgi:hypothetical protein